MKANEKKKTTMGITRKPELKKLTEIQTRTQGTTRGKLVEKAIKYSWKEVDYAFGSMNNQVSDEFRIMLDEALTKIPAEIVDWASKSIIFVSSRDDCHGYFVNRKDWKTVRGFVFLCEVLKNKSKEEQASTIVHEIAHAKLNHRSPILCDLSQEDQERQEKEADNLARAWIGESFR
jgi:hypothetical protein